MQSYFNSISDYIQSQLKPGRCFTAYFSGEESDFVRFNHAKFRQAGSVTQKFLHVDLIESEQHATFTLGLSGNFDLDKKHLSDWMKTATLSHDPHLLYNTEVSNSDVKHEHKLPNSAKLTQEILKQVADLDFVGIYAAGSTYRGFSNSFGQRNWLTNHSFNLDFSCYLHTDKAVKSSYAGFEWDDAQFAQELNLVRSKLAILKRPAKTLSPGKYRTYLSPAALLNVIELLNWGAFSEKEIRTKQSPLFRLREGAHQLHTSFHLSENTHQGIAPAFQSDGFVKPDQISLIQEGQFINTLISPRSAKEYNIKTNGANTSEALESVDIAPGNLPRDSVLKELGTGLFINNLWYLNYSDRPACRMTGMTRFATFWVENGEIVAPVNVMRFDDSVYDIFGSKLLGMTRERDFIIDDSTYEERSLKSARLPGALINDFKLTL